MKFEIKFYNDIHVVQIGCPEWEFQWEAGSAPLLGLVFQDSTAEAEKMQKKQDLSIVGVISHTNDMCGTNLKKSVRVNHCENMAGPEPLIEKLARNDVKKARWIGVEVKFVVVLYQAILCLCTYWSEMF